MRLLDDLVKFGAERMEWKVLMARRRRRDWLALDVEVTDADEERVVSQLRVNSTLIADSIEDGSVDLGPNRCSPLTHGCGAS